MAVLEAYEPIERRFTDRVTALDVAVCVHSRRSTVTVPAYRSVHVPGPAIGYVEPWSTVQEVTRASTSSLIRQVVPALSGGAGGGR